MKEKLLKVPIFFLFVTGVLCALRTAAYFSDYDDKMNTAAVGSVITEIDEDFPDPTPPLWVITLRTKRKSGRGISPEMRKVSMQIVMYVCLFPIQMMILEEV